MFMELTNLGTKEGRGEDDVTGPAYLDTARRQSDTDALITWLV